MMNPTMMTGYTYTTPAGDHWTKPESELWETVVHTATGTETFLGRRRIDGARVNVWASDGVYLAQTALG